MLDKMASIGRNSLYWLALALIGLSFEAVALFYQYVLEEMPCVLCIQVRLWVMALIIVSLLVLLLRRVGFMHRLGHLLTVVIAAGMLERSYQLLGTERGFAVGDCGFDLGLPAWLLFGITMAEALIVVSAVFVLVSIGMTVAAIARFR
jgi:disulfide bond formation protein DsbB